MSTHPESASVVNKNFYIDDYLYTFEDVTHANKISRRDLISLLKLGGFSWLKFTPDERVINKIRLKDLSCEVDNCLETILIHQRCHIHQTSRTWVHLGTV